MLVSDKTYSVVTACDFHLKKCPVETEELQYGYLQVEPKTDETSLKKVRHSENETPGGVNLGYVSRYLQSHWFYLENNEVNVEPSKCRN